MLKPFWLLGGLLLVAMASVPANADPLPLGGECDGLVDVDCTDYTGCLTPECEPQPYRHCLVWYTYLDFSPAPEYDGVLCEDNPYHTVP